MLIKPINRNGCCNNYKILATVESKNYQLVGDVGSQSLGLKDAEDLVSGDETDLCNSVTVWEDDTDLKKKVLSL